MSIPDLCLALLLVLGCDLLWMVLIVGAVIYAKLPIGLGYVLVNGGTAFIYAIAAIMTWPNLVAYPLTVSSGFYAYLAYEHWKNRPRHKKRARAFDRMVVVLQGKLGVVDR